MSAQWDGYEDDTEDNIASYAQFENDIINSDDIDRSMRLQEKNKLVVKNNMYFDISPNGGSREACIDRVEMNKEDGYLSHSVLEGKKVRNSELSLPSWYDQSIENVNSTPDSSPLYIAPKVWATQVQGLGFGSDKIGNAEGFFSTREDFIQAFGDEDFTEKEAMQFDTRNSPGLIGFKPKLNSVLAFSDIIQYCQFTGFPFGAVASMVSASIYFAHEVLTTLVPRQIVLVMYSYSGQIDIPRKDYIPNVIDPTINFPDYQNRLKHVIEMMKKIASKRLFDPCLGDFYLKLSITPAMIVVNFISSYTPQNVRLILEFPAIDNQVLYDCEVVNAVSPMRFTQGYDSYWNNGYDHGTDFDVLNSVRQTYECKLNALDRTDIDDYLQRYMGAPQAGGRPFVYPNEVIF